jgi:hypothetical protein
MCCLVEVMMVNNLNGMSMLLFSIPCPLFFKVHGMVIYNM